MKKSVFTLALYGYTCAGIAATLFSAIAYHSLDLSLFEAVALHLIIIFFMVLPISHEHRKLKKLTH